MHCRSSAAFEAPNARRTAISFSLAAARASSKFATFAQTISNTSATALSRINAPVRKSPKSCSRRGTTIA
jgi:hypothetical protein